MMDLFYLKDYASSTVYFCFRDAFVRVIVVNKETKKAVDRCITTPSNCVSILHRSKQVTSLELFFFLRFLCLNGDRSRTDIS